MRPAHGRFVRRSWWCRTCGRAFFLIGRARDSSAPRCWHDRTTLAGARPTRMERRA